MLIIYKLDRKAAEEMKRDLGLNSILTSPYSFDGIFSEAVLHSSCIVVLNAEEDSKTMILRNGKAFLLDSDRFYKIVKV